MKTNITVNAIDKSISVSKAFYKKASQYGTPEYKELRNAMQENPNFDIVFKTIEKKTYHGLDMKRMEAYIKTQANSEEHLKTFIQVQKVAEAKGSKYPLTKKWFLETFPQYKSDEVCKSEAEALANTEEQSSNKTAQALSVSEEKAA